MILFILRGAFLVLVAAVISLFVGQEFQAQAGLSFGPIAAIIGIAIAVAGLVIGLQPMGPGHAGHIAPGMQTGTWAGDGGIGGQEKWGGRLDLGHGGYAGVLGTLVLGASALQ